MFGVRRFLFTSLAALMLAALAVAAGYAQDKVESLPVTLDGAVTDIISRLSEQDKKTLREMPKKDLIKFHFGWGRGIRNNYGLWGGRNEALLKSACGGRPCHPDDASMVIMEGVWETLNK